MGRRKKEEMQFGSDSFLDVIANIVGILIILIVIAGVRVSQQAAEEQEEDATATAPQSILAEGNGNYVPPVPLPPLLPQTPEPEPILTDAIPLNPLATSAILAASEPPKALPAVRNKPRPVMPGYVPETPKPIAPSAKLQTAIASFQAELNGLDEKSKLAEQNQAKFLQWNRELQAQIESARKTLQHGWNDATLRKQKLRELQRSLERSKVEFIGKQQELTEAEKQKPPKDQLRHRLTPISRAVEGHELHFHLRDNRVAYVPLMELVKRMMPQIQRQSDWLMKYHEHRGRVGPYRGFHLDYLVVRQRMSALDSARGGGLAREIPMLLKFEPEADLTREALDQALRPGSVFIRELQMADVNTTLTFWVYPDSFGMYRQLKEFAHAEGFSVAARPLQEGDVITASPWGTKSAGQ